MQMQAHLNVGRTVPLSLMLCWRMRHLIPLAAPQAEGKKQLLCNLAARVLLESVPSKLMEGGRPIPAAAVALARKMMAQTGGWDRGGSICLC